ncbi:MAG: cation:proton antiporter subunit C [Methanobrevibacter sp.]|jgi:energy-converting hydrogenase B subunit E|nr:cation:proton antiporter subunit C [Methanobrevibacter sp.]
MIEFTIDTQLAALFTSAAFIVIGLFAAIFLDNIIKKIIGIAFIEEGANLFIVTLGYKQGGIVPIFLPGMNAEWFAANSAYPLPHALVLTSIVIGASTLAVMLAIAMVLYRKYGSLSTAVILGDKKPDIIKSGVIDSNEKGDKNE